MTRDTLLLQAKSQKEDERRAAANAAQAADARVAAELAAAFTATHTPQRLQAFVDSRLDSILSSRLFSESTSDGACLLLYTTTSGAGVYSTATRERGGYYGEATITRAQALDAVVAALGETFCQFGALDAAGGLRHPSAFDASGWQLVRASVERVMREYVTCDV